MGTAARRLLDVALRLLVEERAELAARLLRSLDDEPDDDAVGVERAWEAEIVRRREELRNGSVELADGDELLRELDACQPPPR